MRSFYFLTSKRGGRLCIWRNYIYNFASLKGDIERFRCQDRLCNAAVYIQEGKIIKYIEHTHQPAPHKIKRLEIREQVRTLARDTTLSAHNIIVCTTKINKGDILGMPSISQVVDDV